MRDTPHTVTLGRYEYTITHEPAGYYVTCQDTTTHRQHTHGPFAEGEAQAMIAARVARDAELKRE